MSFLNKLAIGSLAAMAVLYKKRKSAEAAPADAKPAKVAAKLAEKPAKPEVEAEAKAETAGVAGELIESSKLTAKPKSKGARPAGKSKRRPSKPRAKRGTPPS